MKISLSFLNYKERKFTIFFTLIVLLELLTGSVKSLEIAHYLYKPAIVASLIVLVIKTGEHLNRFVKTLLLVALLFSLLGDIVLMFSSRSEWFFIGGLVAFLIAHLCYIVLFYKQRGTTFKNWPGTIGFFVYAMGLFYMLYPYLGEMLFPVLVYMMVILAMASAALLRSQTSSLSYNLVLYGALCFLLSDSLLAINKFYIEFSGAHIAIMLSYALAQYLIVIGLLKIKM